MNGEGAPNPRRHDTELFRVVNKSRLEDFSQQLRSQIESPWALFFPTLPLLTVLCVGASIGRLALSISATWAVFDFYKSEPPSAGFVQPRDVAFFLAVLGNILPALDNPPLLVYALTGLTRSTRGWAHALLSIGLCATSIICSGFLFPVLEQASHQSSSKRRIFQSYYALLGLHSLALTVMVTMTLLRLYIPCPTRLPRHYKPFVGASKDAASTNMVDEEDSGEGGPLASLFSQQQHGLRRRRYEQSACEHSPDRPHAPSHQPVKKSFILLNDGTLDLVPDETPILEVEQKPSNTTTPKPITGGFWPGPQINILHFALAALGLLAAAAHVGIQMWRYTTFISSGATVDEYFGGQWQLRVSLTYPVALIIALGPTLILYFLRISPTSHVYGKATAGDAVMLVTAGAIGLFLTGIVVTSKRVRVPPLGTDDNKLSPRLAIWVVLVVVTVWFTVIQVFFYHRVWNFLEDRTPRGPNVIDRAFKMMDRIYNSCTGFLEVVLELCVLEAADRYPRASKETIESTLVSLRTQVA